MVMIGTTLGHFLTVNFLYFALSFAWAVALLSVRNLVHVSWTDRKELVLLSVSHLGILGLSYLFHEFSPLLFFSTFISLLFLGMSSRFLSGYTWAGKYFFTSNFLLFLFGLLWSFWFILTIPVSPLTRGLMLVVAPLLLLTLPSSVVQFLEQFEVLCRKRWVRPRFSLPSEPRMNYPKISLHVPIYAEPPELVTETLNVLSRIDYPNFEVLVVDNNTKDVDLWKPVERHCRTLGERFKFFHVDPLAGAKAGALNFALTKTAPDAEIVGVIDADYQAQPDFLKALVGYFDDPKMGFVQTPHDYRAWENNAYLRMCYFEYKIFFHTTMVSINERDAALTVGTMCLIRKSALEQAGGWAEWCVTEDSELAIRIHAIGYSSVYLTQSFGKGLIPETFAGYKKQRYRWTAGPVQEFKHHFNLLMLWPWRTPSLLTVAQRIHHFNHGLDRFIVGLGLLLTPLGLAVIGSMVFHHEVVHVPFELWLGATVLLVSSIFLHWMLYKVTLGASLKNTVGALLASKALSHVISIASFKTILRTQTPWHRTNKFTVASTFGRALSAAKVELLLGVAILALVVVAFMQLPLPGLLLMFLIGMSYRGLAYLAAPLLALMAEMNIKKLATAVDNSSRTSGVVFAE